LATVVVRPEPLAVITVDLLPSWRVLLRWLLLLLHEAPPLLRSLPRRLDAGVAHAVTAVNDAAAIVLIMLTCVH
jgi:hypothetical protein